MRIYLDQIGCRLNYSEMETLAARLQAAGHQTVDAPEAAQILVFNSCAVTMDAVRGSRKRVRSLHKANPDARIVLTGCWATLAPAEAAELPGVALVTANERKELLHTLLEPWSADFDDPEMLSRLAPAGTPFAETPVAISLVENTRRARTRAFIKVQDGCNNKCTFCIVTVARGEGRSRRLPEIIREIQALADEGVYEAVITGVHLGSYGRDLDHHDHCDLKTLVATILAETTIPRLRLSSLEPWDLVAGFFELWRQWPARLCPHLHLPLQAGTNRQLRQMARRCTVESFRQLVADARVAIPDLIVTTDLITGFPGESDEDFAEGLAFVEEMRFAHAHIFPYSNRPGTAAANFAGQVPSATKKRRGQLLRAIIEQTGAKERQRFLQTVRPVLFEGEGQALTNTTDLLWHGLTDNYLRVAVEAPAEMNLHNCCLPVTLVAQEGDQITGKLSSYSFSGKEPWLDHESNRQSASRFLA